MVVVVLVEGVEMVRSLALLGDVDRSDMMVKQFDLLARGLSN